MAAPYILAGSLTDAHRFAQDVLGLERGHYRIVMSVGTLKAVRNTTLHLVPGWRRRFDRFAMQSALRWTRLEVIDHAEKQAEEPAPAAVAAPEASETKDFTDFVTNTSEAPAAEEEPAPAVDETPAEAPKRRRRRRCAECGDLVDPDEVESHAAEHTSQGV